MFTRSYVRDIIVTGTVAGIVGMALGYIIGSKHVLWKVNRELLRLLNVNMRSPRLSRWQRWQTFKQFLSLW